MSVDEPVAKMVAARKTTDFDERAGALLKHCRSVAGVTQESLAKQTGLTYQQIQKYEGGNNRMNLEVFAIMADIIGFDPGKFIADLAPNAEKPPIGYEDTPRDVIFLTRIVKDLPQGRRSLLLRFARMLLEEEQDL